MITIVANCYRIPHQLRGVLFHTLRKDLKCYIPVECNNHYLVIMLQLSHFTSVDIVIEYVYGAIPQTGKS